MQGPAGSLRNAMRWHLTRDWRWQQQAERLWHKIWGEGDKQGGTCREGDCTGKDWRGGAWYSPFDWRQKNRVPENFLQWSYLRDIPRTIAYPRSFFPWHDQRSPGGGRAWWNPKWPKGDNWNERGGQGPGGVGGDGRRGGGMNFPRRGPGGGGMPGQLPGATDRYMPMPKNFMPNPARNPARPGGFPRSSSNIPSTPPSLPSSFAEDNSAEELWTRLLAGLDNETASSWDPTWLKENAKFWQDVFSKGGSVPWLTQGSNGLDGSSGNQREDAAWRDRPGLFGDALSSKDHQPNLQIAVGKKHRQGTGTLDSGVRAAASGRGSMTDRRGRPRPASGNFRFKRSATDSGDSSTPAPLPPSPTTQTGASGNTGSDSSLHSDDNPTLASGGTKSSVLDTDDNETQSGEQGNEEKNEDDGKSTGGAEKPVSRSLGWSPFIIGSWWDYAKDTSRCDDDSWVQQTGNDMSNMGVGDWDQQQRWVSYDDGMSGADIAPTVYPPMPYEGRFYEPNFPWWMRGFPNQRLGTNRFSPPLTRDNVLGGRRYFPFSRSWVPRYGPHRLIKRSPDETTNARNDKTAKWVDRRNNMGPFPNQWNNFGGFDRFNGHNGGNNMFTNGFGMRPQWWGMWNNGNPWAGGTGWNQNPVWRRQGMQTSSFPTNMYPSMSTQDLQNPLNNQHFLHKRSSDVETAKQSQYNDEQFAQLVAQPPNSRFSYPQFSGPHKHVILKRSMDYPDSYEQYLSTLMNGRNSYQPQLWNRWNMLRSWYGNWNRNWMWKSNDWNGHNFAEDKPQSENSEAKVHIITKRDSPSLSTEENHSSVDGEHSVAEQDNDRFSRMMGGYGGYWPQWWNMWNNYRYWPSYWNNWMWNNNRGYYPFFYSNGGNTMGSNVRTKRNSDGNAENSDKVSRMMGGYGGYWPQWWNTWNGYWPGYWLNCKWRWNDFYPFGFAAKTTPENGEREENVEKEQVMKRSTREQNKDDISRMMGGYGGYWPQWWYMWNRHWPGYWMNWQWRWNGFHPFGFATNAKTPKNEEAQDVHGEHTVVRRSTRKQDKNEISRMMGGYGGYWPQWWNMWNNYRYWPSYWNNNWMENSYMGYYPFYHSQDPTPMHSMIRTKRNVNDHTESADEVSRMMGGYGGHWPQWWYMWNRYWPGYWMNWQRMWNGFGFATKGKTPQNEPTRNVHRDHTVVRRSTSEQDKDEISRMMGGYGGYWPQWWNMWNSYRYWPSYWNGGMWNNYRGYYPFHFSRDSSPMGSNMRTKRSVDENSGEVSRMMGGYGGYWPQWWYMWNRYWPGYWMNWRWMWNGFYPFGFANNEGTTENKEAQDVHDEHTVVRRSTHEQDKDDISRMMGGYGGYWPQWWNMWSSYRYWPSYWNGGMWNNYGGYNPFYFSKDSVPMGSKIRAKRNADDSVENSDAVSRMMGGYGGYWPQGWNMWNRYWPGYWMNRRWMWNGFHPYGFTAKEKGNNKEEAEEMETDHTVTKRNTFEQQKKVSRMMGGPGSYWPQWWNMWSSYGYRPSYWNNWSSGWMGNHRGYYPFYFSEENQPTDSLFRTKRNAVDSTENPDKVSRMMGGYGGYWPQWGYMWNRYWPGYWMNWQGMWNGFYPFGFATEGKNLPESEVTQTDMEKEHTVLKRSTQEQDENEISKMMGGPDSYWPQQGNMWNSNRYWPSNWNNNWMWNSYRGYYPFQFSKTAVPMASTIRRRRNADDKTESAEEVSRMMGGYGGYWPQWWNMWNNYRYWPSYGNNNRMWNNNMGYYPFYYSQDATPMHSMIRTKRNVNDNTDSVDEVSRMMGGYGGHWPQWWNMWNNYRYWPSYGNNNRMWNNNMGYYPFYYSQDAIPMHSMIRTKRNVNDNTDSVDEVSRMMGGYGGYWPQWWNMWNNYRYWPSYGNNNRMWNNNMGYYPFHYSQDATTMHSMIRTKRNVNDNTDSVDEVSRMMGGYGGYMWNRYRPGYWMNWRWMWNRFYPFGFASNAKTTQNEEENDVHKEHTVVRRSTRDQDKDEISRMMGGYGSYWPQWWNMWSSYRYWPGYWNGGMWNNYQGYYPFYFSSDSSPMGSNMRAKRNADASEEKSDEVSRMMGGYGGYWPQWWYMWNRHWPGYGMNWQWMWNGFYPFGFATKAETTKNEEAVGVSKEDTVVKRSTRKLRNGEISRMMGGYGGYWPQWWNMWSSYRYWPGYWNGGMWNNYRGYSPFYFSKDSVPMGSKIRAKRSADDSAENSDAVSRMMGGYGGYWPQGWNMWNRYWPGYWMNRRWMWNGFHPYGFTAKEKGNNKEEAEEMETDHTVTKRNTFEQQKKVSRMMGGPGSYWPQWWNMWSSYGYWPSYWNNWSRGWMGNHRGYYPFYFSEENQPTDSLFRTKRNAVDSTENPDKVSRMMGGYGGYWPQWGYMWNRYWPDYWMNWQGMWNGFYPFGFATEGKNLPESEVTQTDMEKEHTVLKRSTQEQDENEISKMMGGPDSYWPQQGNMWNSNRYWPSNWNNNWMWNSYRGYYPFQFSKTAVPMASTIRRRRNADDKTESAEEVSRMMGGYGGYWPQWWNMWNNYRYWPSYGNNNRMWNNNMGYYPFYYSQDATPMHSMIRTKRNVDDNTDSMDEVSRMMGGYGGHWPQWWNMWNNYRYWPSYGNNNRMWNNNMGYHPFYYSQDYTPMHSMIRTKRDVNDNTDSVDEVSRMMGGYGGNWPRWWNMWNTYWPGYWMNWQWMWKGFYPFGFASNAKKTHNEEAQDVHEEHTVVRRSTHEQDKDEISRMMGGYGGYWPQWWNMWNNYRYWPSYWNGGMWNNQWGYYPFYFSKTGSQMGSNIRAKRDAESSEENSDEVSRMMGGYGGYWPQWWYMWNRYWPGYWMNWRWMWNGFYPFGFTKTSNKQEADDVHKLHSNREQARMRRSTRKLKNDQISRMMGGYGSYWPQWWNMRNNYRYWPSNWNNWMWNNYMGYYPFYFSKDSIPMGSNLRTKRNTNDNTEEAKEVSRMMGGYGGYWPQWGYMWNRYWPDYRMDWQWMWNGFQPFGFATDAKTSEKQEADEVHKVRNEREQARMKRSTSKQDKDEISRMMGGYGSYWPQWWNMWNSYRHWPSYWNGGMWNNQWGYYPFYFAKDGNQMGSNMRAKRDADDSEENSDEVSRMMGGYGSYWPQWWYMWNRYWPGYWMNWRWMWNGFYPFGFANNAQTPNNKEAQDAHKEQIVVKRSTHEQDKDEISRMMGGYGGYWPQWWNMWNNYRYWPGYWNGGMWNNYGNYYPFYFSTDSIPMGSNIRAKRNTEGKTEEVSRMMGGYGGYWPQWWYMWSRYWPGYWMNRRWMWNGFYPFGYAQTPKDEEAQDVHKEHTAVKRSTHEQDKDEISRMMGGYGGYWPQWWNMWNNYRYWPGYWNNGMWNNYRGYYPSHFSKGSIPLGPNIRTKRKANDDTDRADEVSRMMGGYGGYWPQWWYMWNRYWPGYGMNRQWMTWNTPSSFAYATEGQDTPTNEETYEHVEKEHTLQKRSIPDQGRDLSSMMGGPGSYWPQWWSMWNSYRYWPSYWNNMMWNGYRGYYPFYFSTERNPVRSNVRTKRSAGGDTENVDRNKDDISKMMGGYDGFWPQQWNMRNQYPANGWNNWYGNNNYQWMWDRSGRYVPPRSYYFTKGLESRNKQHEILRRSTSTKEARSQESTEKVAHMMGLYMNPSAHPWNTMNMGGPWPGADRGRIDWPGWRNNDQWMSNSPAYIPYNWLGYPQGAGRGFPSDREQPQMWNYNNNMDVFRTFYPSAFSQNRESQVKNETTDQESKTHLEKRSAEATPSEQKTTDNTEDTNSTKSKSKPSVSRQMSPYERYPGNMFQQYWLKLYKSYLNSRPRYWSNGPGFSAYDNLYDGVIGVLYGSRYGRCYYVRFIIPWAGYLQMLNNRVWRGDYPMWSFYSSHQSPTPFEEFMAPVAEPDLPIGQQKDSEATENEKAEEEVAATENEERRKRSTAYLNPDSQFSPGRFDDYNFYNGWPNGWRDPMYNYNFWPRFGAAMPRPGRGNWNSWVRPEYSQPFMFSEKQNTDNKKVAQQQGFDSSADQHDKEINKHKTKRSAQQHGTEDQQSADEKLSRWFSVPSQGFGQPMWQQQDSWMYQTFQDSRWNRGQDSTFRNSQLDLNRNKLNQYFMQNVGINPWSGNSPHGNDWGSLGTRSPFDFSQDIKDTDERAAEENAQLAGNTRRKRSSDPSSPSQDDKKKTEEEIKQFKVSRAGRGFPPISPRAWNTYGSRLFDDRQWMRYNWPGFDSNQQRPWWSSWNFWNQYQNTPDWNQYQYVNQNPSMDPVLYGPGLNWRGGNEMYNSDQWKDFVYSQQKPNRYENKFVDESIFDPLSSYYFSQTGASGKNNAEKKLKEGKAGSAKSNSKMKENNDEQPRTKRSAISLTNVLSKRQSLEPNRLMKRSAPKKIKRFSPDAIKRLERRFQKRSATSTQDSKKDKSETADAETAPVMAMRATAPARGSSSRDREWGPPRGSGFPPNPNPSSRQGSLDQAAEQNSISGQGPDTFGDYGGQDDWNWGQPGWDEKQKWSDEQKSGKSCSGKPDHIPNTPLA